MTSATPGTDRTGALLARRNAKLYPDARRVVATLFVPGERAPEDETRASGVVERIMALSDHEVDSEYAQVLDLYSARHRDIETVFADHFDTVDHRLAHDAAPSARRRLLIGAYFTCEYAIEGASLTNPSMVQHPDQSGLAPGELRFLMSARAIGEGQLSCIEFRTGVLGPRGGLTLDEPTGYATAGRPIPPTYHRDYFLQTLNDAGNDTEVFGFLHRRLPEKFTYAELEQTLAHLPFRFLGRRSTLDGLARIHWTAACRYDIAFPPGTDLSERVLWPYGPTERHGMEDARFVRSTADDGTVLYRATYTAVADVGAAIQLIETEDFATFQISQLIGPAAQNKGLALFPRPIGGVHFALSRWNRENNSIATSHDGRFWDHPEPLRQPSRSWELVQTGNCGSPVETPGGWLVLTHGVGPMRRYRMGAMLLDLDDPRRITAILDSPLLTPDADERNGFVPNVVYSCGALRHGDTLAIPYGFSDMGIGFATVSVAEVIGRMRRP